MRFVEKSFFAAVILLLGVLSLWLQFGLIERAPTTLDGDARHDPDYYVENFTAIGMDEQGRRRYVLEAERMVHYPDDDTALLDNPHVIQYEAGQAPRHTYSESGWMSPDGNEILLTGNVRVVQGRGQGGSGGVMTTEKLRILLEQNDRDPG